MTNRSTSSAPTLARSTHQLEGHVEELRAELASVLCPVERRQIERELQAVRAELVALMEAD